MQGSLSSQVVLSTLFEVVQVPEGSWQTLVWHESLWQTIWFPTQTPAIQVSLVVHAKLSLQIV